eukprot:253699-Amphidinium_carterae.1
MKKGCSIKEECCNFLRKPSTMTLSTCWELEKKPEWITINRPRMLARGLVLHPTWTGTDQYGATVQIYPPREMPDSPDPDWEAIANAQPLTGEELETAVTDRLLNILTPNSETATPVPTANTQLTFAGTAHRLEAEPKDEPVSVDSMKEKEEPIEKEPETVPETPSAAAQIKPPSVPTESPASTSEVQAPPEWDNWQIRILQPAPKPL